jgi:GxxExxY protein
MKTTLLYKEESYKIIGACFEVYNEIGNGFLEAVYQECLCLEFDGQGISYQEKPQLKLDYKGKALEQTYKPDYVCHGKIILELKAVKSIADEHRAQVFNYLKATGLKLGLIVNFGSYPDLEYERIVKTTN